MALATLRARRDNLANQLIKKFSFTRILFAKPAPTPDQVELADKLGIDYAWEVEHHFLEEYSHSSAPEIFLAACSQRTRNIRLGHGICLMPPKYNHPARVAERIATLDLVSNGRVEFGTGESASLMELGGFNVGFDPVEKRRM